MNWRYSSAGSSLSPLARILSRNAAPVSRLKMPEGTRLISVAREGRSEIATGSTKLEPGDRVLAILQPGCEDELRRVLLKR